MRRALWLLAIAGLAACRPDGGAGSKPLVLRVGSSMDLTQPSPLEISGMGASIADQVFRGLMRVSAAGVAEADLAESWSFAEDGRLIRLKLKKGVKFSDGTPLTIREVSETFRKATAADVWGMDEIRAFRTVGEDQLEVEPVLPWRVPSGLTVGIMGGDAAHPVGTGPMVVGEHDATRMVLQPNARWGGAPAGVQAISFHRFETASQEWSRLLGGEVDLVTFVPWAKVDLLKSITSVRLVSSLSKSVVEITFVAPQAPFDRAEARYALSLAINRAQLVDSAMRGHGRPARGVVWPEAADFDASLPDYPFDPGDARRRLIALGCTAGDDGRLRWQGQPLELHVAYWTGFSEVERVGLLVQRQLADIGVTAIFEGLPIEQMNRVVRERAPRAVVLYRHATSDALSDREAQALLDGARPPASLGELKKASAALQRRMRDEPPSLYLIWPDRLDVIDRRFCGLPTLPDGPEAELHRVHRCAPGEAQ